MDNPTEDEAPASLHSRAAMRDQDHRSYPLPSGRRGQSPRTMAKRATEAAVVVCLTLFCVSLWNKATAPNENPISPAFKPAFTLVVEQDQKYLVIASDLVLENAPTPHKCLALSGSGTVDCYKLKPSKAKP